jgi:hypothetical protein|tara:strand:- start:1721 stop:2242 length:522 start_codon:yes stop_codon:yes gene_type:complete
MIAIDKKFLFIGLLFPFTVIAQESIQSWSVSENKNTPYNDKIASLSSSSFVSVRDETDSESVYPLIEFYCENNSPDIFLAINWRRFVSSFSKTEIGMAIDNNRAEWISVKVNKGNQITTLDFTHINKEIIHKILAGTLLKIEIEPYSEPSIFSEYNLEDFSSEFNNFIQLCKK